MKKSLFFAFSLILLAGSLCSCQKNQPYEERLQGQWVPDSREVRSYIEFNGANYNLYYKTDEEKTIYQSDGNIDASAGDFYLLESKSFKIEDSYAVMLDGNYWGVITTIGPDYFDISDHSGSKIRYLKLKKFMK